MFVFMYGINCFMAVIGVLHILRKIGPNHFVGIRIGKTLGNERLWYDAHVFAGWSMLITSVVSVSLLIVLQTYARYRFPDFPAVTVGAIGATVLLFIGDAIIPLILVLRMPDDGATSSDRNMSDILRSDYTIAVYVLLSSIMIILSLPQAVGRIEPNGTYGFRTAKTLSSDALWYASNRFMGWAAIIAGFLTIGGLMALRFGRVGKLSGNGYAYLLTFLVPSALGIIISVVYVYCVL